MRALKWTRRATGKIARQLRRLHIRVGARTVARLLKKMGFSLRVNRKMLESGNRNPPSRRVRNRQFAYIQRRRKEFTAGRNPIISVDTKKKELIGRFKNPGARWERQPQPVNDHDFRSDAKGMAIPYGIYDPGLNSGVRRKWGPAVKRRRLLWMPSACGGSVAVRDSTQGPRNCSFSLIRVAAIVHGRAPGSTTYNTNWPTLID